MLRNEDLDAAVARGIVTEAQALSLREFARQRDHERAAVLSHEERFRFMRGFNDFFFAVGIALFGFGIGFFAGAHFLGSAVAAALMWGLAEILVRRMRLVLPGILIAVFFIVFVYRAVPVELILGDTTTGLQRDRSMWGWVNPQLWSDAPSYPVAVRALVAAFAAGIYYFRFRLPFALLPIAASLVLAVLAMSPGLFPTNVEIVRAVLFLLCGLAVFSVAMAFDLSDRERVTRYADCAFWLHLLAAPLIVHSLVSMVVPKYFSLTAGSAVMIVAIIAALTVIAITIDRRALLVSALSYLGIVIGFAITGGLGGGGPGVFFATLVILGALVLVLGVGWHPLRRLFIGYLPAAVGRRLPPEAPRA